ncbi:MAG: hypothetical protein P1P88_01220 [Bacteroidales bacterium]|nr:hypothetical protein [Bacteroidales bacterium]
MAKTHKAENITLDRIRAWLNDPDSSELSETDRAIYDRWDFAYDQLKIEKPAAVINRLMVKFDISKAQAYVDIRNCQRLLNPINRRDSDWLRNFIVDDAILQIKVARERVDSRAWQKARADLIRIYAIEKDDNKGIDPELLGGNEYFITINFGDHIEKINMNELHKMPLNKRIEKTEFLFQDIDEEDAKFILES